MSYHNSNSNSRSRSRSHSYENNKYSNKNQKQSQNNNENYKREIHIAFIPLHIQENDIRHEFEKYGKVQEITIVKSHDKSRQNYYGFAKMSTHLDAEKVLQGLKNHEWKLSYRMTQEQKDQQKQRNQNSNYRSNNNNYKNNNNHHSNKNSYRGSSHRGTSNYNSHRDHRDRRDPRDNRNNPHHGSNNRYTDSRRKHSDDRKQKRKRSASFSKSVSKSQSKSRSKSNSQAKELTDLTGDPDKLNDMLFMNTEDLSKIIASQKTGNELITEPILVRELHVSNLPQHVEKKTLENVMRSYGQIEEIELRNQTQFVYAFVKYYKVSHATEAFLQSKGIDLLMNAQLKINFSEHQRRNNIIGDNEEYFEDCNLSTIVYIGYHPKSVKIPDQDRIKKVCSEYGDIKNINYNKIENTPLKSYYLLEYTTVSQARRCYKNLNKKKYKLLDETCEIAILSNSKEILKGKDLSLFKVQKPVFNNNQQQKQNFQNNQAPQQNQQQKQNQLLPNPLNLPIQQLPQQQGNNNFKPNLQNPQLLPPPNMPPFGRGRGNFNPNFPPNQPLNLPPLGRGLPNANLNNQNGQGRGNNRFQQQQFNNIQNQQNPQFNPMGRGQNIQNFQNQQQNQMGGLKQPNFNNKNQPFQNQNPHFNQQGRGRGFPNKFNPNFNNPQMGRGLPNFQNQNPNFNNKFPQNQNQQQFPLQQQQLPFQNPPFPQNQQQQQQQQQEPKPEGVIDVFNSIIQETDQTSPKQTQEQNNQLDSQTQNQQYQQSQQPQYDPLEDQDAFWSGFITRSKNQKVGVDIKVVKQNTLEEIQLQDYHLCVQHRANYEDIFKKECVLYGVMMPSNETQNTLFFEFSKYFYEKQKAGVIQTQSYLIYLMPQSQFTDQIYNISHEKKQLLVVVQDINAKESKEYNQEYQIQGEEEYQVGEAQQQQQEQQQQEQQQQNNNQENNQDENQDINQLMDNPDLLNKLLDSINQNI